MQITQISYGHGGWCLVQVDDPRALFYVRATEAGGRLRVTEFYVDGRGEPLSARALRVFPLAAVEEWLENSPDAARSINVAGPDLSRLASNYGASWGPKAKHWVADSWRAQYPDSGVPQAPMGKERPGSSVEPRTVELDPPEDGRLSDEFLTRVAAAYQGAVEQRRSPAKLLSELAGVSDRTVHRWVYTARKRGLMAPASRRGRIV